MPVCRSNNHIPGILFVYIGSCFRLCMPVSFQSHHIPCILFVYTGSVLGWACQYAAQNYHVPGILFVYTVSCSRTGMVVCRSNLPYAWYSLCVHRQLFQGGDGSMPPVSKLPYTWYSLGVHRQLFQGGDGSMPPVSKLAYTWNSLCVHRQLFQGGDGSMPPVCRSTPHMPRTLHTTSNCFKSIKFTILLPFPFFPTVSLLNICTYYISKMDGHRPQNRND